MRSLGKDRIEAFVYHGLSDVEARLAEIAENLHRAELTQLQRAEQIDEYSRLAKEERGKRVSGQLVQKPQGGRPEGGDSAAARDLGLNRKEVERAGKIANIAPEAKIAAKRAKLDDNQSALLKVAEAPKEKQVEIVKEFVAIKAAGKVAAKATGKTGKQSVPRRLDDVQATVEAILRDFSPSDVSLIINGLSEWLAGHHVEIDSLQTTAEIDNSANHSWRGDDDAPATSGEIIEEIEEFGGYTFDAPDIIEEDIIEEMVETP